MGAGGLPCSAQGRTRPRLLRRLPQARAGRCVADTTCASSSLLACHTVSEHRPSPPRCPVPEEVTQSQSHTQQPPQDRPVLILGCLRTWACVSSEPARGGASGPKGLPALVSVPFAAQAAAHTLTGKKGPRLHSGGAIGTLPWEA